MSLSNKNMHSNFLSAAPQKSNMLVNPQNNPAQVAPLPVFITRKRSGSVSVSMEKTEET